MPKHIIIIPGQLYLKIIKVLVNDDENIMPHSAFPPLLLLLIFIVVIKNKHYTHTRTAAAAAQNKTKLPSSQTVMPHITATNYYCKPIINWPKAQTALPRYIYIPLPPPEKKRGKKGLAGQVHFKPGRRGAHAPRWTGIYIYIYI